MSFYDFAPIAAALSGLHVLVEALISLLQPLWPQAAPTAAILLVTIAVRVAMIPLSIRAVRAERSRAELAPSVAELRRRYAGDAARLGRELAELYRRKGVSPAAGLLPLLAQAPVLSLLYGVFSRAVIAGSPNLLLTQQLLGMPFSGAILPGLLSGVLPWPAVLVSVAVLCAVALAAELARRPADSARSTAGSATPPPAARALAATLPFAGLVVAAFVPFAAALYLATSAVWGALERPVLTRLIAR